MAKDEKGKGKQKSAEKGKWSIYKVGTELTRERKSCPKCGSGVFMAQHQDRLSCGKCGYTEFTKEKIIHVFPGHHKVEKPKEEKAKVVEAIPEAKKDEKGKPGKK